MFYLTELEVEKCRELLAAGVSVRETARRVGRSRWVVTRIKRGDHRHRYRNPERAANRDDWKKRLPPDERAKVNGKPWRCSCGLLVRTKTCLRCAVVQQKERA